jgi:small nuclear ribonucleoprotein (snRNP)-like protein
MIRITIFLFVLISGFSVYGQDIVILNSGEIIKGKIIENSDSLVVIKTQRLINEESFELNLVFNKTKIREIIVFADKKNDSKVIVSLFGGRILYGQLVSKNEEGVVLTNVRGLHIDTLAIKKSQIKNLRFQTSKEFFVDVGLLRGGALLGAELEYVVNRNMTFFLGGGFKGFAVGLNYYFNDNYSGFGMKSGYFHQGFGDPYAGSFFSSILAESYLSFGVAYKFYKGISIDLGVGYVMDSGHYNSGSQGSIVLTYGIGYRF